MGSWAMELLCPLVRMGWHDRGYAYSGTIIVKGSLVGGDAGVAVDGLC